MKKQGLIFSILQLLLVSVFAQQRQVTITPQQPERGQQVTVTYHPDPATAKVQPELVFSYSNLYGLPLKMPLQKQGNNWQTSFVLPRYAVFATFYVQHGDSIIKPAAKKHYELAVYTGDKRVKNGLLYKAYSLGAQMGKSDDLPALQAALFQQELQQYPDNYEARVRLLYYQSQHGPVPARAAALKAAHTLIAKKFNEQPGNMDNLNKVTMAYLILGENSRLDSIRKVVLRDYPESSAGRELYAGEVGREPDTTRRISMLEKALEKETPQNSGAFNDMHKQLFDLYAAQHSQKALYHARIIAAEKTPYRPSALKDIVVTLTENRLSPDTALSYAQQALAVADSFPVGIIRYFPETGYIPAYVTDSARRVAVNQAKGNLLSLMAILYSRLQQQQQAEKAVAQALSITADDETLLHAAHFYTGNNEPEKSYHAYHQILLHTPGDTVALNGLKQSYISWKGSDAGLDQQLDALQLAWKKSMKGVMEKQRISKPAPVLADFVDMDGKPVPVSMLKGKIVIIDFWATWCIPCMKEMPFVQKVYEKYKDNPDVLFMIVNSGARNTLADAQGWSGRKRYTFPVYYNKDAGIGDKLGFNIIPATFLIDKKGALAFKTIGFEGPGIAPKLDLQIEMLLEESE